MFYKCTRKNFADFIDLDYLSIKIPDNIMTSKRHSEYIIVIDRNYFK